MAHLEPTGRAGWRPAYSVRRPPPSCSSAPALPWLDICVELLWRDISVIAGMRSSGSMVRRLKSATYSGALDVRLCAEPPSLRDLEEGPDSSIIPKRDTPTELMRLKSKLAVVLTRRCLRFFGSGLKKWKAFAI